MPALVADVLTWPYTGPALLVAAILWLIFVGEPRRGVVRHPWWGTVGWMAVGLCAALVFATIGFAYIEHRQQQTLDALTGAKNYAYYLPRGETTPEGDFFLEIRGTGPIPGMRVGVHTKSGDDWKLLRWFPPEDYVGHTIHVGVSLSAGSWRFDFVTMHATWREYLEVSRDRDFVVFSGRIERLGETIPISETRLALKK